MHVQSCCFAQKTNCFFHVVVFVFVVVVAYFTLPNISDN